MIASESSLNSSIPGEGQFKESTLSFTSGSNDLLAGQNLGIRLVNLNSATGIEVNFDNVRLDATAVPEPGSISLFALSMGLIYVRRRISRLTQRGSAVAT